MLFQLEKLFYSIPFPINLIHTLKPMKEITVTTSLSSYSFSLICYTISLCTRTVSLGIRTLLILPMQVQQHRPPRGRSAWIRGRGVRPSPATVSVQLGTHPQPTCRDLQQCGRTRACPSLCTLIAALSLQEEASRNLQRLHINIYLEVTLLTPVT